MSAFIFVWALLNWLVIALITVVFLLIYSSLTANLSSTSSIEYRKERRKYGYSLTISVLTFGLSTYFLIYLAVDILY